MQTTQQLLKCKPVRLQNWESNKNNGRIVIIKSKYENRILKKLFEPFLHSKFIRINLDDLGSEVWINCDGHTSVQEIGEILGGKYGPQIEPIYERLIQFILELKRSKFIRLECPAADKS